MGKHSTEANQGLPSSLHFVGIEHVIPNRGDNLCCIFLSNLLFWQRFISPCCHDNISDIVIASRHLGRTRGSLMPEKLQYANLNFRRGFSVNCSCNTFKGSWTSMPNTSLVWMHPSGPSLLCHCGASATQMLKSAASAPVGLFHQGANGAYWMRNHTLPPKQSEKLNSSFALLQ